MVDNYARVLNEQSDPNGLAGAGTLTQMELTKKVQDDLQKSIQSLLEQVLGPNKAAVRVSVELNFDQKTVDRQVFEPVVDDKGIVRSSQEADEDYKGSSPQSGGVPGTTSNIPGYVTSSSNSQSTYEKKEVTRNYEVNETKEKVVVSPGSIRRLTVAVLVDSNVTKAQQDTINKTVSSAIGFNPVRGDVISVETIPFNTEATDKQNKEEEEALQTMKRAQWMKWAAYGLAVLGVLYLLRSVSRRFSAESVPAAYELSVGDSQEPQPLEKAAKDLSPHDKERLAQRETITKMAKSKPDDVAQLIKTWLNEE